MLIFSNPGELDPRLISTFGVNTKPNTKNPIGFFGTGLKYALAVLIRLGASVVLQTGTKSYVLGKSTRKLRDKNFDIITLNRRAMPFTTELGKAWLPWMAYRELYCNALDENGEVWSAESAPIPEAGWTRIVVSSPELELVHHDFDKYFIRKGASHLIKGSLIELYEGPASGFFYRSIFVGGSDLPMVFRYNITHNTELSEDRLIKSPWTATQWVSSFWTSCEDEDLLEKMLCAPEGTLEAKLDFSYASPVDAFYRVVTKLIATRQKGVNQSAAMCLAKSAKHITDIETFQLSTVQQKALDRALDFLERLGARVRHEIIFVESLGRHVFGQAKDNKIWLSREAFTFGTKFLASTIYEEHIHLTLNLDDESREMQNFLFDRVISLGEELLGEAL